MALFGNSESKEEKKAAKVAALLKRYGLEEISDPRDAESVKQIAASLAGNNLIEIGTALSGSAQDVAKMSYLSALVEQNWIIIRQLDKLNNGK
jgi:hypothetical protein